MAVKRGLNKERGLNALFPQRLKQETGEPAAGREEKKPETTKSPVGNEKPVKPASKAAEKPKGRAGTSKPASKKPAAKKTAVPKNKPASAEAGAEIREIRLGNLVANEDQPRKDFDDASIAELAESVKIHGILQPLLVQKKGRKYEIIAGERRFRAAALAGLKTVPVIVKTYSDKEVVEISLIENIQREDLNPLEEALAYQRLLDDYALTQEEIARRVSKSRAAVANALRLLKLDGEVAELLRQGKLSGGHARALLSLESAPLQRKAAEKVIKDGLSVRATEKLVKRLLSASAERKTRQDEQIDAIYRSLADQLQKVIGTKVNIKQITGKKGTIEIEYYSQEDLERIIDMIG